MQTIRGRINALTMPGGEICPTIQSIVVVTSPIGDQAPPALAATMIIPAKKSLISRFETSLRVSETRTMVVVRLYRIQERINVNQHISQMNVVGLVVLDRSLINLNPQ